MKTNYQMLKELDGFNPETSGVLTWEEIKHVRKVLCLKEMDKLALRNLRDFAVMYYDAKVDSIKDTDVDEALRLEDKMSGVVSVIDSIIWSIGEEA